MGKGVKVSLLIALGLSVLQAQSPAVDISLTVSDGSGGSQQLRFGLDASGTDGIDAGLGESELPPMPPSGVFDARFVGDDIGLSLGQGILKDYRQGSSATIGPKVYEIKYQVGTGTSILITWNLPSGVTGRLQDVILGSLIDQTMSGNGNYTVPNPGSYSKLKMTITYTGTGRILGDVDGNGTVQAADASLVLQHVAGLVTITDGNALYAADASRNGSISAFDAALILQAAAGIIVLSQ